MIKTLQQLIEVSNPKNFYSIIKYKHPDLYVYISEITKHLNCQTFNEKVFQVKNNFPKIPVCPTCGKLLMFHSFEVGYKSYCNKTCYFNDPKKQQTKNRRKETVQKKYGVEYVFQSKEVKQKIKNSTFKKYGVTHSSKCKEVREKFKKTSNLKYGFDNPFQNSQIRQKFQKTIKTKYQTDNIQKIPGVRLKIKNTLLKKYNFDNPMKIKEFKEKNKNTCLSKYGVENIFQFKPIQEKIKRLCMEKYNVDNPSKSDEVKEKIQKYNQEKHRQDNENKLQFILDQLNISFFDYEYQGNMIEHCWLCLNCKKTFYTTMYNILYQNYLCPFCFPRNSGRSLPELELEKFFEEKNIDIIVNDKTTINPFELDIFIPSKNIAIEFNGLYWHSTKFNIDKDYHKNKTNLCREKNIRLIQIFEDEWAFNKELVKKKLLDILGYSSTLLDFDDCFIKEINSKIKDEFLENFHIQGKCFSDVNLGVFYRNQLIFVMTFLKIKDKNWELNRICTNYEYEIPKIENKVLIYFRKNFSYEEIYSYVDLRWSDGNFYKKLGFENIKVIEPKPWYLKNGKRLSIEEDDSLNEKDIIWDCGYYEFKLVRESEQCR